ncbi:MAG: hypothetical protein IID03_11430 [Candidatus Dadabacteria bacterium]|nr:hypothetical protein [Candidatus Dadabacteria bacterium]
MIKLSFSLCSTSPDREAGTPFLGSCVESGWPGCNSGSGDEGVLGSHIIRIRSRFLG